MKITFLYLFLLPALLSGEDYFSAKMRPSDLWEIRVDIDGDGITDRIVSEPVGEFGTMGGSWDVFLGLKEGGFRRVGEICAHPLALRIERSGDSIRLWVYLKINGSKGSLGYYALKNGTIGPLQKIEFFPGATDLCASMYDILFSPEKRCIASKKTSSQALEPTR